MKRLLTTTAIVAGTLWFGPAAYAVPEQITTTSDFVVDWNLPYSGGSGVVAKAHAEFDNFVFTNTLAKHSVTFDMDVTNTSTGSTVGGHNVRFTSFGWDTVPASTFVSDTTTVYTTVINKKLGQDMLSVCFYSGPNCDGGAGGGLQDAQHADQNNPNTTGKFSVEIDFGTTAVPPLTFDSFDGKFQGDEAISSIEGFGTVTDCPATGCVINPLTPAPEPASLALLGVGLLGLGMVTTRRRNV